MVVRPLQQKQLLRLQQIMPKSMLLAGFLVRRFVRLGHLARRKPLKLVNAHTHTQVFDSRGGGPYLHMMNVIIEQAHPCRI